MGIRSASELKSEKIKIDLTGPEGNAFNLLAKAKRYGSQLGFSDDEIELILGRMKSSDYDNLVEVFDEYFGDYVDLYR